MSGLETAIRQALERSDRENPETRARIYQSARNALENGLRKQDVHDPETVAEQRHRLEAVIHAIEIEERAAAKAKAAEVLPPSIDAPAVAAAPPVASEAAPVLRADDRRQPLEEPAFSDVRDVDTGLGSLRPERDDAFHGDHRGAEPPAAQDAGKGGKRFGRTTEKKERAGRKPRRSRRSRLASLFMVAATLVATLGTAAWWAETSGLFKSPAERNTAVANPPTTVHSEDFDGTQGLRTLEGAAGFSGDWLTVMDAGGDSSMTAGPRATVTPLTDDRGARLRITSTSPDAEGSASIAVPVDVLQQLSGKTSTLALTVQSDTGKPAQFSVECDFASLGDCGRHRFTVNDEKNDMLFKVTFDRSLAPSSPGHILINSDVSGAGGGINLFAVRVLPGQ